jgi:hypothetical protein
MTESKEEYRSDGQGIAPQEPPASADLQSFKNVTNNLMQDALNVWSDLWAELEGHTEPGTSGQPRTDGTFEPSCGWTAFLQKMWTLRHYLDFAKRFSQQ